MAAPDYSVASLIENIDIRCSVPTSQLTYTDADWAVLANNALQDEVVPLLMSTREEYFVDFIDVPSPADGIISFPTNTVASKVRSVCYLQQTNPLVMSNLPRIDLDIVAGVGFSNLTTLAGFYVMGNSIRLYPNTSVPTNTMIRIFYYKRTLVLVPSTEYAQVVSIDVPSLTIQISGTLPQDWIVGTNLNSISNLTPFQATNELFTITNISSPSIVVTDVTGIQVGDYISEYGYSAIPQIPIEAHGYLAQLVAAKALEGLGDREGMQAAASKANDLKTNLLIMLSQRVDGSVKKVMSPNGGMRLGAGVGYWARNRGY